MSRPGFRIDVQGFDELRQKIVALSSDKSKKREIIGLLKQEARPTLQAARTTVPISKKPHVVSGSRTRKVIQPGSLRKSLGMIVGRRGASAENPTVYVGPRAKGSFDGWYGAMVEAGHNIYRNPTDYTSRGRARKRNTLSRVRRRGTNNVSRRVEGQFYMKRAWEQTEGTVTAATADRIAKYIQRRIDALS